MTITINERDTWGQYAPEEVRAHASAPPEANLKEPWSGHMGVFLHHLGAGSTSDLRTEEDCRRTVAKIYWDHKSSGEYYGDIAYNFLVCPHGQVYEGRGYERGEGNQGLAGDIEGVGRNAGFYSIVGMIRSQDVPTETLLRSIRGLIDHLRHDAPRNRTGDRIFPHSFNYETDCPGNLHMYARPGSVVDPSAAWRALPDIYVSRTQRWVNNTYKTAPGYVICSETGYTGWNTVLALTQGLQHELGISPTVQNFGPGTFDAVRNHELVPEFERNENLLRLYNGALWCKGYWASQTLGGWGEDPETSLRQLYADMGLNAADAGQRLAMWPHVLKALLRMDQFRLVPGGDPHVRAIQQRLNSRYVAGIGIPAMSLVPCDGIYSRDVQQGLMMAIQYEIGIAPGSINGYFGPGTQAALKGRGSATLSGDLRYLFRAACYFNSPTYTANGQAHYLSADIGTDAQTGTHTGWLQAFQRFSQLPVTGHNDYATWAQLLVSSGDTSRDATGCDCITEITPQRGQLLKSNGYRIVGRYLDEHLAPGDDGYLGKALKPGEPQTILNAGLRFFPIFQYNGTQLGNFTYDKGYDQGKKAHAKAVEHGIGAGTCIYFGVDYDATDEEITSHVVPYFNGVRAGLAELGSRYTFGVYGSRNVCIRVSKDAGARWSFVSGMSWGFSGNLGFPLPENWSFNQIHEYQFQPGWGLDHNIWRDGGDPGVSAVGQG
ncbi:peptidoglycan hydrolase-like protein with peptidoglycan-binding domain [Streptomyces sp. SAI-124]|uniref:glycoside hydrolase domain-containing protein n=1 Tax=unclassified Streptomyces TaxID=2593676 RepID=UPI002473123F|nr:MULTISPECIES: glycoside hydrolase domain-containing protein [unclassified Streptomyces]MDH6520756.1 peptidoglycan hydrolase-like protein with peptidoglycan-binding domain [Streptomyces sp. SAI-090]MDH6552976.1 peptidoglycan hydrolase-like protein with peptidoglycan-binding domain [Streptomyces sp. SAI-041]MDH6572060.1 peptidoglycan hydrolase-like protein with peptidoglycan-binding domain [Streptomyces sp. SAI-117]